MKRFLAFFLSALLLASVLTACGEPKEQPQEAEQEFTFTRENMPRLDGSTSTAPLALAACAELLGEAPEDVEDLVHFNKTTTAYFNLLEGNADLLIIGEANEDVLARKEELGFAWEKQPFATDAFVFVVNEDNPVDSITVEQAKKIYTGEITNWKELGGEDRAITALQRNSEAGSQTLMEKLVMQGTPMMEAPKDYIVATMGQLMEAVKSYDGSPGAIGYSVYYYAEEMKMAQGLKLLKLDGVEPNPDTIRSETYPLVNPKYVVIPADAAEDAPNRAMFNWLLSEAGQTLIAKEGYVSILDVGTFPKTAPTVGTRLRDGYIGELIPSEDYGELIPYAGRRLMMDWPSYTGCMYGLMTRGGMAVTDAVYASVGYATFYTGYEQGALPLLILKQGDESAEDGAWDPVKIAVAASDGSWITPFDYKSVSVSRKGLLLYSDEAMTVMEPDGTITKTLTPQEMGISEAEWDSMRSDLMWGEGVGGRRSGDMVCITWVPDDTHQNVSCYDLAGAQRTEMPYLDWEALDGAADEYTQPTYAVADAWPLYDSAYGSNAPYLLRSEEYGEDGVTCRYYRADGTPLEELTAKDDGTKWYYQTGLVGGLIEVLDLNTASYYDLDTMECVFRTYLGYEAD